MTIITYLSGYILIGIVMGWFPDIGIEISKKIKFFIILFWPIVLIIFIILGIYTGIKSIIK